MTPIFVDTSAWAAIADSADQYHEVALLVQEEIEGQYQPVQYRQVLVFHRLRFLCDDEARRHFGSLYL